MSEVDHRELRKKVDELDAASRYCDDELGEWWAALSSLYPRVRDAASEEFCLAWEKEFFAAYENFKSEFSFVEETVTDTRTIRTLKHYTEQVDKAEGEGDVAR